MKTGATPKDTIEQLMQKTVIVPGWTGRCGLLKEYDPMRHPVMDRSRYPDVVRDCKTEHVTRVVIDLQRLAAKRMTELCVGIPAKRAYSPENDRQKEVAGYIEKIFTRNRINSVNVERLNMLFAGCEVMTLWYAVEERNTLYGFDSNIKLRCRNFSPMLGDGLWPLFDEYGDMIALSVSYTRKRGRTPINFFETYTADRHIKWSTEQGDWNMVEDERTTLGKIPGIYMYRPTPIWENTSNTVYEMEWALSRNGNYLRENSKPMFVVFADDIISYGKDPGPDEGFRSVLQFPKEGKAEYITWQQAVENLKFYMESLRSLFFTQLQLPDWSYERMSQQALSGESRKQLFIDGQMKVGDESGRLLEFFDREVNVVKAYAKAMLPDDYAADIDALPVENQITAYTMTDEKDTIENLMTANGNKPIISQREAIEQLGWSDDVDQTMKEIGEQDKQDAFNLSE